MRLNSLDPNITERIKQAMAKGYEVFPQPKYHYREIVGNQDGSVTIKPSYDFFSVAKGQEGTTLEDTNMDKQYAIPSPDEMWVQGIKFIIMPSKTDMTPLLKSVDKTALEKHLINDMGKILNRGVVNISQLSRDLLITAPLITCPASFGVLSPSVFGFDANISCGIPVSSVPLISNGRPLELYLASEMTFQVKIDFLSGVFPLYNNLRMGFILEGFYLRPKVSASKI
ncbi:MAG: hypothetical protein QW474_01120 [Candidatus Aenigmatarchaeota archaeon]